MNNFWRSLEMPLISLPSTKLDWKFEITKAKLQVPIVTLFTKDSVNLTKQLKEDLKDLFIGIVMKQNLQK